MSIFVKQKHNNLKKKLFITNNHPQTKLSYPPIYLYINLKLKTAMFSSKSRSISRMFWLPKFEFLCNKSIDLTVVFFYQIFLIFLFGFNIPWNRSIVFTTIQILNLGNQNFTEIDRFWADFLYFDIRKNILIFEIFLR